MIVSFFSLAYYDYYGKQGLTPTPVCTCASGRNSRVRKSKSSVRCRVHPNLHLISVSATTFARIPM